MLKITKADTDTVDIMEDIMAVAIMEVDTMEDIMDIIDIKENLTFYMFYRNI